ncbi:PIN-like domain-containing protein [Streptomyces nanshensis]|uniref:PIN-like domain-containing protein n=1 Tax=Streptomyces nanshensis TaxID=518642 RepID=UPI00114D28F7|nr:PIN domain-containing protein [Streptomyces nanshensis]
MDVESSFIAPFAGHWRAPKTLIANMLGEALIVLDSSVLLNLYRAAPSAREEMLQVLQAMREKLWLPHQVAAEFHRNRVTAARDQINFFSSTVTSLEKAKAQAVQALDEFSNRCALEKNAKEELKSTLDMAFDLSIRQIGDYENKFDLSVRQVLDDDPILTRLSEIFDGRVGPAFSSDTLKENRKEAERRIQERVPPGYKDAAKGENSHGDYFWWEQTLREAESRDLPVLIVSNDLKEDWMTKRLDFVIGPREELVAEMATRVGKPLHIMHFASFLEAVRGSVSTRVSESTVHQAATAKAWSPRYSIQGKGNEETKMMVIPEEFAEPILSDIRNYLRVTREALLKNQQELDEADPSDEMEIEALQEDVRRGQAGVEIFMGQLKDLELAFEEAHSDGEYLNVRVPMRWHRALRDAARKIKRRGAIE